MATSMGLNSIISLDFTVIRFRTYGKEYEAARYKQINTYLKRLWSCMLLTFYDRFTFPLLFHRTTSCSGFRKGRLIHKRIDIVILLKFIQSLIEFIFCKERYHMSHLYISQFGIQIINIHLLKTIGQKNDKLISKLL